MKKLICMLAAAFMFAAELTAQVRKDTDIPQELVQSNVFLTREPDRSQPPAYADSRAKLPRIAWPARPEAEQAWDKAWQIAFSNLHAVNEANGFISPFIDAAFNRNLFMWDSGFMVMFGKYGARAFDFQGTLNNFYGKQHKDGFISRQISWENGVERYEKFDVSSTGPNVLPWSEWEYFLSMGDTVRLKEVFVPLVAYYRWLRDNRSWPDGSYFSSGWGCGMDNQPRVPQGYSAEFSHGFMSWVDVTLQQAFAADCLLKMAAVVGRTDEVEDIAAEAEFLKEYAAQKMWDPKTAFYYDRYRDGTLNGVKSVAGYWALLSGVVPQQDAGRFIAHLENPAEFARYHRVPTLSADNPSYDPQGDYWRGGVWPPTTYMVLRGLTRYGCDSLAYAIARNHYDRVMEAFHDTGTFWENYAPEQGLRQSNSRPDFVGWTGLVPISVLLEYVFGIRPEIGSGVVVWDVRLTDEFGVENYPIGPDGVASFRCEKRRDAKQKPKVKVRSSVPITVKLIWAGGSETFRAE